MIMHIKIVLQQWKNSHRRKLKAMEKNIWPHKTRNDTCKSPSCGTPLTYETHNFLKVQPLHMPGIDILLRLIKAVHGGTVDKPPYPYMRFYLSYA